MDVSSTEVMNGLLEEGGVWVNLGPLNWRKEARNSCNENASNLNCEFLCDKAVHGFLELERQLFCGSLDP